MATLCCALGILHDWATWQSNKDEFEDKVDEHEMSVDRLQREDSSLQVWPPPTAPQRQLHALRLAGWLAHVDPSQEKIKEVKGEEAAAKAEVQKHQVITQHSLSTEQPSLCLPNCAWPACRAQSLRLVIVPTRSSRCSRWLPRSCPPSTGCRMCP